MERGDVRPREGPRKSDIQHLRGTSKAQTTELGAHGYLKSSQDDQATASGLLAEPQEAADVARIFDRLVRQLLAGQILFAASSDAIIDASLLHLRGIRCQIRVNAAPHDSDLQAYTHLECL